MITIEVSKELNGIEIPKGLCSVEVDVYDEKECNEVFLHSLFEISKKYNFLSEEANDYFMDIFKFWVQYFTADREVQNQALIVFTREYEKFVFGVNMKDFDVFTCVRNALNEVLSVFE